MAAKSVRSFARGLEVLEALNQHGSATALVLSRHTKVPRGTVYRLLQTLQDAGYVERSVADERYALTLNVRRLSGGFEDEQWISQIARPSLVKLTRRISWPCDILTFQDLCMVIRDTTHPTAPFSIDRNMVGRKIPMLASAAGLTYLAHVPEREREQILDLLATSSESGPSRSFDAQAVGRAIDATHRQGFGLRQGGAAWPHTGAIALPIRDGIRVLGCISVIWMSRVVDEREGVRVCLEPLLEAQAAIERELDATQTV